MNEEIDSMVQKAILGVLVILTTLVFICSNKFDDFLLKNHHIIEPPKMVKVQKNAKDI